MLKLVLYAEEMSIRSIAFELENFFLELKDK